MSSLLKIQKLCNIDFVYMLYVLVFVCNSLLYATQLLLYLQIINNHTYSYITHTHTHT